MYLLAWLPCIDAWVWGYFMMFLLVGTGVYLTIRMRFIQVRLFRHAWSLISGKWDDPQDQSETTHLQALSTALSATIGTGNIAGVSAAIVIGGPGAVFWMWVTGFLGMCTKGVSALLALAHRKIDAQGNVAGGPMYYLHYGLKSPWLGALFAFFTAAACFGIGNMVPANSVADPLSGYIESCESCGIRGSIGPLAIAKLAIRVTLAVLVTMVIIGGIRRIAKVAEKIVSPMAGLGSAPIAHASARTKEPVREGLVAMLGPSIDTLLICTITALVVITSGLPGTSDLDGASLSAAAFETGLGTLGRHIVFFGLIFFAFTSMIGWSYYGDRALHYLFRRRSDQIVGIYCWVYVLLIPVGAVTELKVVWTLSDIFNGLMAFPNLVGLIALSGTAAKLLRDCEERLPTMRPVRKHGDLWFLRIGRGH